MSHGFIYSKEKEIVKGGHILVSSRYTQGGCRNVFHTGVYKENVQLTLDISNIDLDQRV